MIKEYLKKCLNSLKMILCHTDKHVSMVSSNAPWVYFSYIPYVYNHLKDEEYMCGHQNRKETVAMVDVFNELGYNVYLHDFTINTKLPNINPKIEMQTIVITNIINLFFIISLLIIIFLH